MNQVLVIVTMAITLSLAAMQIDSELSDQLNLDALDYAQATEMEIFG